jgi:hypothetical protein
MWTAPHLFGLLIQLGHGSKHMERDGLLLVKGDLKSSCCNYRKGLSLYCTL